MTIKTLPKFMVTCGCDVLATLEHGKNRYNHTTEQEIQFFDELHERLRNEVHTSG